MESKAKLLGHAIHPMLIVFPLGLLATAVIFDLVYFITSNSTLATVSFWMMAAGIVGGLLAAPFGWIDWFALPSSTRAKRVGLWHGLGNVVVLVLFIASWLLRRPQPDDPETLAFVLALAGAALALVTSWLGGELVDRLGVGIDTGAHLDAPSSLAQKSLR